MAQAPYDKKEIVTTKIDWNVRKKQVYRYIWDTALRDGNILTLLNVDQISLDILTCCWRRMEKIIWADRMKKEEILQRVQE
jgi:hypothetical protein